MQKKRKAAQGVYYAEQLAFRNKVFLNFFIASDFKANKTFLYTFDPNILRNRNNITILSYGKKNYVSFVYTASGR